MKSTRQIFSIFFVMTFLTALLTGCGQTSPDTAKGCPFTTLTWESSYEDMTTLEGTEHESYESVYGGITYTYSREYLERTGTIKYMFDDGNHLMCVAWAYVTDSVEDLDEVYHTIHEDVVNAYGESGFDSSNSTSYGDVWYLESGDILISAMTTEEQIALQYAYLNPLVSNKEARK